MIEHDTVELLRECDAGIRTGIATLNEVKDSVNGTEFKNMLDGYQREYALLQNEIRNILHEYGDEGKKPNPMAKGMAWLKTNFTMAADGSDAAIANIITDGCNTGIKSLNKYLNDYKAADERAKDFAKRLIGLQSRQLQKMRAYL